MNVCCLLFIIVISSMEFVVIFLVDMDVFVIKDLLEMVMFVLVSDGLEVNIFFFYKMVGW